MANVQHASLTGSNLHEPKGADSAAANTVYVADGGGSGNWELRYEDNSVYVELDKTASVMSLTGSADIYVTTWTFDDYNSTAFSLNAGTDLTVLEGGLYLVSLHVTLIPQTSLGASNETITASLRINGTVTNPQRTVPITITRNSGLGDPFVVSITRIIDVTANDVFSLSLNNGAATRSYSVAANFNMVRFGNL